VPGNRIDVVSSDCFPVPVVVVPELVKKAVSNKRASFTSTVRKLGSCVSRCVQVLVAVYRFKDKEMGEEEKNDE
jgi:hypothetical protein